MQIEIRTMREADAAAVNALTHQLGYPLSIEQTTQNINAVLAGNDRTAFVAVLDGKITGWIGLAFVLAIEVIPYCEINGLVVDQNCRGMGVGKLLIEKAKQWAKEKNCNKLRLRCNVIRTATHLFYQHLGFNETKRQINFEIAV